MDELTMIREYPEVQEIETSFLLTIIEMYHEIEQLLFVSPPLLHESLRSQLRDDLKEFKKMYSPAGVKKEIKGYNHDRQLPEVEALLKDKEIFKEYHGFISYLASRFEKELMFFTQEGFETVITSESHIMENQPERKAEQPSTFIDPSLSKLVRDEERFLKVCEHYLAPVDHKKKTYVLMRKESDGYHWKGPVKKGIPALGALLYYMMMQDILYFDAPYEGSARTFLSFFHVDFTKSTTEYLSEQFQKPHINWLPMIEESFPSELES